LALNRIRIWIGIEIEISNMMADCWPRAYRHRLMGILWHPAASTGSLLVACQQMHSGKSPRGKCINIRWIYARFAGSQIHANDLGAHQIKHNLMGYTFHNDKNQLI